MIPTYASFRPKPPVGFFDAVAISGSAANLSRNIRVQFVNRAGRSLLSDPIAVSGSGVSVTLNDQIESGEEIFWIGISVETTGLDTDAGIIYLWQAREPDQLTKRSLPVTIDFISDDEFVTNRSAATVSILPGTGFLPGAIALALDSNVYYRYDPEAFVDPDGRLYSYGALAKGLGQWIEYPFNQNAYVLGIAGLESSDRRINTVATSLKVPPKIGAANGTRERYWLNNGLFFDSGSPIITGKFTLEILLNGVDYTSTFADRIAFYLIGYVDRDTGILDTSIATVGIRQVWNPTENLIVLPEELPRNYAAVYDFSLEFDNDDLVGFLPTQAVELELDIVEVLNVIAKVSELGKVLGDIVLSEFCQFLVVPGLTRLGGAAIFATGFTAEDPNDQPIPGIFVDTIAQQVTISGSLNGLADIKQPADVFANSEVLRAVVSTEPGLSRLFPAATITLAAESIAVTLEHPITATGAGIIRSDYPDEYLAGIDKARFTPVQLSFYFDIAGNIYSSSTQTVNPIASQDFTFDLADLNIEPSLPIPPDPFFGLFEPISVVASSGGTGSITGNVIAYVGYFYESPNSLATSINHLATGTIPKSDRERQFRRIRKSGTRYS